MATSTVYKHNGKTISVENHIPDPIKLSLTRVFWFDIFGLAHSEFQYQDNMVKRLSLVFKLEKITADEVHYASSGIEEEDDFDFLDEW